MNWKKILYNNLFAGFLLSVVIVFFSTRSFNSAWHRFITADGFGYYAYLPAKYIYNDSQSEFKWFNKVYHQNYSAQNYTFPDENFLVKYKDKKINKYYPGLSVLWIPFFAGGHLVAKLTNVAADGYSAPYQIAIGIGSLFYLLLGLFFLRKLLYDLFKDQFSALLVPFFMFYGTWLFMYGIDHNSLSHIYSFTFITMMVYYANSFFNKRQSLNNLLMTLLCLIVIVCIRPVNIISALLIPAFVPPLFFKSYRLEKQFKFSTFVIVVLILVFLYNQIHISIVQTGGILADTYTDEKFYFNHPKLFDVLFSYHAGLFVYCPVILFSFIGLPYIQPFRKKALLLFIFFLIIYIYSSWWYWPITTRTLIDYYVIAAIFIAALISAIKSNGVKVIILITLFIFTAYHQLKSFQLQRGILDGDQTYSELFWSDFFRINKTNKYVIPPSTILNSEMHVEDFEKDDHSATQSLIVYSGKYSGIIDKKNNYSRSFEFKLPGFYNEKGIKKMRFSFWSYFEKDIKTAQVYLYFYDKDKKEIDAKAFYISETILYHKWDLNEFGYEFTEEDLAKQIDHITLFIWNSEAKDAMYIDDVKTEFFLTDRSFEIVQ